MHNFKTRTTINAPVNVVWQTLADIGTIYKWNPGVRASHLTSKQQIGVGAARFCDLGGKNYLDETVVVWQPEAQLTMRITATNMPFASADIQFFLNADQEGNTAVTVSPRYQLKWGLLGRLLNKIYVGATYKKGMAALLAGLKAYVERQTDLD